MCYSNEYRKYISSGDDKMKKYFNKAVPVFLLGLVTVCCIAVISIAQDSKSVTELPEGVYMKLDREFYESLRGNDKTYSNNKSTEYLREISISTRFTVETNLQIIKQQEQIIRLLEKIADNKK